MIIDKNYCMSSFLTFRYVARDDLTFGDGIIHKGIEFIREDKKYGCSEAKEIDRNLRILLDKRDLSQAAILLSGGIDSGILASYMPKGTKAYTAMNSNPISEAEVKRAEKICEKCGLQHVVVSVTWDDYLECMDDLMQSDGCPVFANEPQVYILAKKAKEDGAQEIIYGDNADIAFGGMDQLLSRDWTYEEWIDRFTFLDPRIVLKDPRDVSEIFEKYRTRDNGVDIVKFLSEIFAMSSSGAYINAFRLLNINYFDPYSYLKMDIPLDLERVRNGESKYLLRELYRMKFPTWEVPEKIAMLRAADIWLKDWDGPKRDEFKEGCVKELTGEQKFLVYSLERFLNIMDL